MRPRPSLAPLPNELRALAGASIKSAKQTHTGAEQFASASAQVGIQESDQLEGLANSISSQCPSMGYQSWEAKRLTGIFPRRGRCGRR